MSARAENLCCLQLKKTMSDITKKYKNLQLHHEAAKKEIRALKKELKSAEQQLRMLGQDPQFLADDQRKEIVKENGLPSYTIKLKYIETSLDMDKENDLKVAPGLSDVHLSVQLFRDEPAVIRYRGDQGQLSPEAESTAWFCELVSRWFTLMSSRHPVVALSHLDFQQHQNAIHTLDLTARTFRQMKMGVTAHWKPSQTGDCLENVFSVVRLKKPVPSALEFKCALRMISVSQFVHTPETSGYTVDDGEYLADLFSTRGRAPLQEPGAVEEDIMDDFLVMTTKEERYILAYVGGFLVRAVMRTINCDTCKGALTSDSNGEYSTLIRLKEYVRGSENLTYPSHAVMQFLTACEEQFKGLTCTTEILSLASPFKTIAAVLRKNSLLVSKACSAHKGDVERLLLDKYLHFRLEIHLKQARLKKRASDHSSKTCTGVNLS
ncbi:hypothetical protein HPB47_006137 [Ixodes persulcatus]|uniref:Uncharacterized protein n=1 Tax=Ixodes persulcatus TaxID=34615 RepID=A0AC60PBU4_IXOPE|nr:hypothetical protein HPB47_006137 [Ixodes persulcatus]